jgi:hypothetical protein
MLRTALAAHLWQVPWELVQEVLHVISALHTLKRYVALTERGEDGVRLAGRTKYDRRFMLMVLEDLVSFCQPAQPEANLGPPSQQAALRQQLFRDLGVLSLLFKLTCSVHARIVLSDFPGAQSSLMSGPVAVAGAAFGSPAPATRGGAALPEEGFDLESAETLRLFKLAHRVLKGAMVGSDANRLELAASTTELLRQVTAGPAHPAGQGPLAETLGVATDTVMELFNTHQEILEKVRARERAAAAAPPRPPRPPRPAPA